MLVKGIVIFFLLQTKGGERRQLILHLMMIYHQWLNTTAIQALETEVAQT